jgi:6,7-dimethyl-8-ribityllumazine synthase
LVEDEKQAYARCIGSQINRGREAARAAASMIDVFRELDRSMPLMNDGKKRYA